MDKIKKIINYVSWIIIGMSGILLLVNWENIPETVVTHIGFGISYGYLQWDMIFLLSGK